MKKVWFLILLITSAIISSCSDDNEIVIDQAWKAENEAAFEKKANEGYTKLVSETKNGYIYYKSLKQGTGATPTFTSKVKVNYKGSLIDGTVFDATPGYSTPYPEDDEPSEFWLSHPTQGSVIEGWITALQSMKEGDKWEIWVPYSLGYGISGSGSTIKGCSTLVFEIELIAITADGF